MFYIFMTIELREMKFTYLEFERKMNFFRRLFPVLLEYLNSLKTKIYHLILMDKFYRYFL